METDQRPQTEKMSVEDRADLQRAAGARILGMDGETRWEDLGAMTGRALNMAQTHIAQQSAQNVGGSDHELDLTASQIHTEDVHRRHPAQNALKALKQATPEDLQELLEDVPDRILWSMRTENIKGHGIENFKPEEPWCLSDDLTNKLEAEIRKRDDAADRRDLGHIEPEDWDRWNSMTANTLRVDIANTALPGIDAALRDSTAGRPSVQQTLTIESENRADYGFRLAADAVNQPAIAQEWIPHLTKDTSELLRRGSTEMRNLDSNKVLDAATDQGKTGGQSSWTDDEAHSFIEESQLATLDLDHLKATAANRIETADTKTVEGTLEPIMKACDSIASERRETARNAYEALTAMDSSKEIKQAFDEMSEDRLSLVNRLARDDLATGDHSGDDGKKRLTANLTIDNQTSQRIGDISYRTGDDRDRPLTLDERETLLPTPKIEIPKRPAPSFGPASPVGLAIPDPSKIQIGGAANAATPDRTGTASEPGDAEDRERKPKR